MWRTISARVLKGGDTEIRFTLIVLEIAYPFSLIAKSIIIQRLQFSDTIMEPALTLVFGDSPTSGEGAFARTFISRTKS